MTAELEVFPDRLDVLVQVDRWEIRALCAQVDPELFFPERGGSARGAKRVCGACPVRSECLEDALVRDDRFGVRGGLSERERRKLLADRDRGAA